MQKNYVRYQKFVTVSLEKSYRKILLKISCLYSYVGIKQYILRNSKNLLCMYFSFFMEHNPTCKLYFKFCSKPKHLVN